MRRVSQKIKIKEKRGQGSNKDYKPWIKVGEFGSSGTSSLIVDWETGRQIDLLSQTEMHVYYLLKWSNPIDIKEQYPLSLDITKVIANKYNVAHPSYKGKEIIMTTDFLVSYGSYDIAISVKADKSWSNSRRTKEKILIEKEYWNRLGIKLKVLTNEDINIIKSENIRLCSYYYDYKGKDDISLLKKLIIRKLINVNMDEELDFRSLKAQYQNELNFIKGYGL